MAGDISRAKGQRSTAIAFYRRFLEIAPESNRDIQAVKGILKDWGVELDDD